MSSSSRWLHVHTAAECCNFGIHGFTMMISKWIVFIILEIRQLIWPYQSIFGQPAILPTLIYKSKWIYHIVNIITLPNSDEVCHILQRLIPIPAECCFYSGLMLPITPEAHRPFIQFAILHWDCHWTWHFKHNNPSQLLPDTTKLFINLILAMLIILSTHSFKI